MGWGRLLALGATGASMEGGRQGGSARSHHITARHPGHDASMDALTLGGEWTR
jgi:hypothetical protein